MKIGLMIIIGIGLSLFFLFGNANKQPGAEEGVMNRSEILELVKKPVPDTSNVIYLAGGCFWGVEGYFKRLDGVMETRVGYANGAWENPTYEEVIRNSGHAETVQVTYDQSVISLEELLLHFLRVVDPYAINKQGNDAGVQYRSGIYFTSEEQGQRARRVIEFFEESEGRKTAIEILPLQGYWDAEEYHQDYLGKNPYGYCHISLSKASDPLFSFPMTKDDSEEALKERIGELAFQVTQKGATEVPFTSDLLGENRRGIYVDIVSGQPLFSSNDKYDARSGWPSFTRPIEANALVYVQDNSLGMSRIEIRSQQANAHLGHVFSDGPKDKGGLRYCVNGAALRFIPYENMEEEGYGPYRVLVN